MTKIMTDSSATMTIAQGEALGIIVNPLTVTIGGQTYLDLEEMTSERFLELIDQGNIPTSSQPSVGATLDLYHQHSDVELLNLTMTDGLSGTYQTATGAVDAMDEGEQKNVHVVNTTTLWAPQGYLVRHAAKLAADGLTAAQIIEKLQPHMDSANSFLIPSDFGYLKRGGRLTPFAANIGGLLKLIPVLVQTEDGRRLEKHGLVRGLKAAFQSAAKGLKALGVDETHHIFISHGGAPDLAEQAKAIIQEAFPNTDISIHSLSPVMITQGGPSCISIQNMIKF